MKQLIILVSTIILGIFIFRMVAGPEDGSIYSSVKRLWQSEIQVRTVQDY
ncbi:MAG: hypothetical protein IJM08_03285 [Firmicutes bacterium]|nr:hypothetical protein [Bacillota bacterium]